MLVWVNLIKTLSLWLYFHPTSLCRYCSCFIYRTRRSSLGFIIIIIIIPSPPTPTPQGLSLLAHSILKHQAIFFLTIQDHVFLLLNSVKAAWYILCGCSFRLWLLSFSVSFKRCLVEIQLGYQLYWLSILWLFSFPTGICQYSTFS